MTFRQFAVNNVIRNKRLYVAYFLSSLFTVMIFFTFAIFAFHPTFMDGSVRGEVLYGMAIAGGIIYVFSFFFVLYSMSSFLQSRKREFGLLMMHGMTTRQIRLMIFMENMLIGFFATLGGILLGLVFAKAILLLAENVLVIDETLHFYFPLLAIILTFVSFIVLFLLISLFVSFILRTRRLVDLIKADKQSKGEPKASVVLTVIAVILLASGYMTALYVKGMQVVMAMLPVIIVVTIGTYLLFTQLSVYVIRRLKGSKGIFWRKTNMVLFSDLSFRMKDNARSFFMVAIISTVAFSAIGSLYGAQSYLTRGMTEANPFSFLYTSSPENDEDAIREDVQVIEETMDKYDIDADSSIIDMTYFSRDDGEVLITNESQYNLFAHLLGEKTVQIEDNEAVVVSDSSRVLEPDSETDRLMDDPVELTDGTAIQPDRMMESSVLPEMYSYYIISDAMYEQLPQPDTVETSVAWMADKGQEDALIQAGEAIFDQIDSYNLVAIDFSLYQINKVYGPILFIGLFIGIVFFVSAGSFLYFRLYTDLDDDKEKFRTIAKMGLTDKELKKVINRQTALLFFAPIVVALIHGAVALTALSHLFDFSLVNESALVLGAFAFIQIIYFVVVRYFYTKQIRRAIF
ncbi:putative ABC transport system permease protein [Lentibacillus halodurans]|uniref:Putative ABC transport system permease protein n=1 Tax=Lentibacillus halodurans TaxID=237679 RepID=A0A1I0VY67_9BACI|nr:ABC transporter permease [Lentibacillus halodurans]SFA81148.1 putative ABC transport system permease protein [Lentibacillus halodurans]